MIFSLSIKILAFEFKKKTVFIDIKAFFIIGGVLSILLLAGAALTVVGFLLNRKTLFIASIASTVGLFLILTVFFKFPQKTIETVIFPFLLMAKGVEKSISFCAGLGQFFVLGEVEVAGVKIGGKTWFLALGMLFVAGLLFTFFFMSPKKSFMDPVKGPLILIFLLGALYFLGLFIRDMSANKIPNE